ncbi:MAG: ABC transporter substrate-binding protein [Anaerolineales bacterium]|nr:zinc ABC transporter substrate-binding protein [Anaerolineae bacterium]PWB71028.1 MAG: ABC transporter substrate-binding protein [Anaerolineales bacterium]
MRRAFPVWILLILILSACGRNASPAGTPDSVILASTTFLADITRNVAGDRLTVESLLPIGADPHSYQPTPQDAARIADSRLLILNGAEYEHFIEPLLENAGGEREVIEASAGISPREDAGGEHGVDPHMWLDPNNVVLYAENIRDGLARFDPASAAVYRSNAEAYITELKDLDSWIVEQVSQIPQEKRLLVTNHESLGYFAERYGFTIAGTIVESFSSGASPSAGQMAGLIDQIKSSGAPAIFLDASDNEALARQIADETGVKVVTDLHLESLTEGPPAGTYIDMMKHNVMLIVEALK